MLALPDSQCELWTTTPYCFLTFPPFSRFSREKEKQQRKNGEEILFPHLFPQGRRHQWEPNISSKDTYPMSIHTVRVFAQNFIHHDSSHGPTGDADQSGSGVFYVNTPLRAQTTPAELLKPQQCLGLLIASCSQYCFCSVPHAQLQEFVNVYHTKTKQMFSVNLYTEPRKAPYSIEVS